MTRAAASLTERGRIVSVLGAVIVLAGFAFGSRSLLPVGLGLLAAVSLAAGVTRRGAGVVTLRRETGDGEHLEGEDVAVGVALGLERARPLATIALTERPGVLGERIIPLRRTPEGAALHGRYVLPAMRRGRYVWGGSTAALEDPFGLCRVAVPVQAPGTLLVLPRLVAVERLFSEGAGQAQDGRALMLRRPAGFDLHSVREYEHGESLRKVHWPTTARRGRLMVKELEDAPRDETAVVLDAAAASFGGAPARFDEAVRAAGSVLRAHVGRGRRSVLVITAGVRESQRVDGGGGDWRRALELLAGAEPTGRTPVAALLGEPGGSAARSLGLTVVTGALTPPLVERLVQRSLARLRTALVWVDGAGIEAARFEPALAQLRAAGVAVAVVGRGAALETALSAPRPEAAARAG